MLIATITAIMILMGGGGPLFNLDIFKDVLKEQIDDKERRKELLAEAEDANEALKTYRKDLKDTGEKLVTVNKNYYASRNELDAVAALADQRRLDTIRQILDARYNLIEKMTKEEWDAMYAGVDAKLEEERKKAEEKAKKK
jgi:regulator of sigma D